MKMSTYPSKVDGSVSAPPWYWTGNVAPDGAVDPWNTAPLGSQYVRVTSGTVRNYLKETSTQATSDWKQLSPWQQTTWTIDGSGRAYGTPTISANMLTDGALEVWTSATNLTSWTETISGTSTVNRESSVINEGTYAALLSIDASNNLAQISQSVTTVAGTWYYCEVDSRADSGTTMTIGFVGEGTKTLTTSYQRFRYINRASGTSTALNLKRATSGSRSLYFDAASVKAITFSTAISSVRGSANNLTATTKINAIDSGTQAGIIALLDSASNPLNFLLVYHNGTSVVFDKCVNGAYTNIASTVTTFVSDAAIELRRTTGNTFQVWYNGTQRGTDQTVSDAGIIDNQKYGLFSTYSGNTFSEFTLGGVTIPLLM